MGGNRVKVDKKRETRGTIRKKKTKGENSSTFEQHTKRHLHAVPNHPIQPLSPTHSC
jgi:hypothetical protein